MDAWLGDNSVNLHRIDDFLVSDTLGSLNDLIPSPNIIADILPKRDARLFVA